MISRNWATNGRERSSLLFFGNLVPTGFEKLGLLKQSRSLEVHREIIVITKFDPRIKNSSRGSDRGKALI